MYQKMQTFKALGPLTRCKSNMNHERTMHQKVKASIFFNKCPKNANLGI